MAATKAKMGLTFAKVLPKKNMQFFGIFLKMHVKINSVFFFQFLPKKKKNVMFFIDNIGTSPDNFFDLIRFGQTLRPISMNI